MNPKTFLSRGDLVKARFPDGKLRPGIVVSPNVRNREGANVILAGCTSQRVDRIYPNEVLLSDGELPVPTKIQADYLFTMRQHHVRAKVAHLSPEKLDALNRALLISLDLE